MLFNSKRDQCRTCFVFHFLLLIWSTTPEKILKLLHVVVKLAFIDLFFDLPLLVHMKTEIMAPKYYNKWMMSIVCDLWQNEEGMIECEDERSSPEPEDNQEQVGHQILCGSILTIFFNPVSPKIHIQTVQNLLYTFPQRIN